MKKILFLSILSLLIICSCEPHHHYKTISKKTIKIKREKTKDPKTNEEFYWYFIGDFDAPSSYYYSSPVAVNDFKTVNWTSGKPNGFNKEEIEEEEIEQVDLENIEASIQPSIEEEVETTTETTSESEGNDGGEGDGGGDGGGGDSGGGDGGGGDGGGGE